MFSFVILPVCLFVLDLPLPLSLALSLSLLSILTSRYSLTTLSNSNPRTPFSQRSNENLKHTILGISHGERWIRKEEEFGGCSLGFERGLMGDNRGHQSALIDRPTLYTFHGIISSTKGFTIGSSPWDASCKNKRKCFFTSVLLKDSHSRWFTLFAAWNTFCSSV